jgi:hypothetical protein
VTVRRPLVLVGGQVAELPTADALPGEALARVAAPVVTSGTAEFVVLQATLPAGLLVPGTTLRGFIAGQSSALGTVTARLRCGAAGTSADALVAALPASAAQAANAWGMADFVATCAAAGAAGALSGYARAQFQTAVLAPATAAYTAAVVNTTGVLKLSITLAVSAGTFTVRNGYLEVESPA